MSAAADIPALRIARHCREPFSLATQYMAGLGLGELGRFRDHDGFDGVLLGYPAARWHLEFVASPHPRALPADAEDALVLYLPDAQAWQAGCQRARAAGFEDVQAGNPYWTTHGASFADAEGFRVILARQAWPR